MFVPATSALMIASLLMAQSPAPVTPAGQEAQDTAHPASLRTVTVPAGTAIPLTLMSPIKSKSTRPGDQVRAQVAFPVTVGSQLAVPAGAFAEGVVQRVKARAQASQAPSVQIHFTRLVFANGYAVELDAQNPQSYLLPDHDNGSTLEVAELLPLPLPGAHFAMGEGQQTTMPPLPQAGPSKAVVIGATTGGFAAFTIGMLLWMHHRATSYDFVVFDAGWQFKMILGRPLVLDTSRIAAVSATPGA